MLQKILIISGMAACGIALIAILAMSSTGVTSENDNDEYESEFKVIIPVSTSRPGCEVTDSCYLPPQITIGAGQTVTWINDDRAFHTVTGGYYDVPEGFDSGHMYPDEKFHHTFDQVGTFHYYCRLHPWMEGTVTVN